jgi:hypothetical protein
MNLWMQNGLEIWIVGDLQVGYAFNLFGGAINWMSKRRAVVKISTTGAKYMATTHENKEAIWLQRLCSSIGLVQQVVRIYCDSQSEIFLAKNLTYHSKTKYIDIQYHFVRDMVEEKKVLLMKVETEKFFWYRVSMGIDALDC